MITIKKIIVVFGIIMSFLICDIASAKTLSFSENQTLPVSLSNSNINSISILNDQINNVICPENACITRHNNNDQSGIVYVQILSQTPFTMYLSSVNNHHLGLTVTPIKSDGKTVVLNPIGLSGINLKAQTWETESSYRSMLITLVRDMMNNVTPDGYGFTPIGNAHPEKIFNGAGSLTLQDVWTGNYLIGAAYIFQNVTKKTLTLSESDFYHAGVRLVATTDQKVAPGQSEVVYEILSRNNG